MKQLYSFLGYIAPTSTKILKHFYEINLAFVKYRNVESFKDICNAMELRFIQHLVIIPLTYYLASVLDPTLKLTRIET